MIQMQQQDLVDITAQIEYDHLSKPNKIHQRSDTVLPGQFSAWLQQQVQVKLGLRGLGIEQYSWYQKHVHLLSMTWQDEERFCFRRELDRAWFPSLKFRQKQRNIGLLSV